MLTSNYVFAFFTSTDSLYTYACSLTPVGYALEFSITGALTGSLLELAIACSQFDIMRAAR